MGELLGAVRSLVWRLVWGGNMSSMSTPHALLVRTLRTGHMVLRELVDGQLNLRVGGLVYTTLLSLVPALAVSFAVLKAFNVHETLEPTLQQAMTPLGDKGPEIVAKVIGFVEGLDLARLGSVGLAALLLTIVSLVHKVEQALNQAWRVQRARGLASRISGYITVVMVGPVLVFTAIGMTASLAASDILRNTAGAGLVTVLAQVLPYLMLVAAFAFIYVYIPNTRVRLQSALVGAFVAALLWSAAGWAFASLVVTSSRYTVVYSSFAILILFMMWLHIAWLIVLIGGSVAFYQQNPGYLGLLTHELQTSNRVRERLGLTACYRIAEHFVHGREPPTLVMLAQELGVPPAPLSALLEELERSGMVARTGTPPIAYLPARSLDAIRLTELMDAIRRAHESGQTEAGGDSRESQSGAHQNGTKLLKYS